MRGKKSKPEMVSMNQEEGKDKGWEGAASAKT